MHTGLGGGLQSGRNTVDMGRPMGGLYVCKVDVALDKNTGKMRESVILPTGTFEQIISPASRHLDQICSTKLVCDKTVQKGRPPKNPMEEGKQTETHCLLKHKPSSPLKRAQLSGPGTLAKQQRGESWRRRKKRRHGEGRHPQRSSCP